MEQANKIFIPELKIHGMVSLIVEAIREDLIESPEKETFLYHTQYKS